MEWPAIRDALQATLPLMVDVDAAHVIWKGGSTDSPFTVGTRIYLSHSAIRTVGLDLEMRDDNGVDDQVVSRVGQRQFTWTIQVKAQNQGVGTTARIIADQIRIRLWRANVKELLRGVQISVADAGATREVDYQMAGRMIGEAAVEVLLNAVEIDIDDSPGAGTWIGRVLVDGKIKDTDDDVIADIALDIDSESP